MTKKAAPKRKQQRAAKGKPNNTNSGSTQTGTLTDRLVRLREDRAAQAKVLTANKIEVTKALTNGGDADALLQKQRDAERKLTALDTAIQTILHELPQVRKAEGLAAAQKRVPLLVAERERCLGEELSKAADARGKASFALTQAMAHELGLVKRGANAAVEIALICTWFGLEMPKLKRAFQPPSDADLIRAIETVYASHMPLRVPTVPHGASETPEQIRRSTAARALTKWIDRHSGSLSVETMAIFELVGTPDTGAERTRREKRAADEVERFTGAVAGDVARGRAGARRAL